jgi:hypothetical protein
MSKSVEFAETWFNRVWACEDASAIDELFVPDGEARGLGANVLVGPEGFKQFHSALLKLLSDVVITIDKSIESDDWMSAICTLKARSRESGADVGMTGSVMFRLVDGRMTEAYNHWDFMGLFGQMGLFPGDGFEQALNGQRVV